MPRFAANLSTLFPNVPFLERFSAAREAGFDAVEFLFPYQYPAEQIAELLRFNRLTNVLFNVPPGDLEKGERGLACIPGREAEFLANVDRALDYARVLGTPQLHAMAGIPPSESDPAICRATLIANLRNAAKRAAAYGITLLLEAINSQDIPGFFINTQAQSYDIVAAADHPNLRMQIDCYHIQRAEGEISAKLQRYLPFCGHIQVAGVPGRHEPEIGEIRYEYLYRLLDELGYAGWVGLEYIPTRETACPKVGRQL